ncbi:hypothetical protein NQ314_012045 [Rhamnusium bicolor]|uniref:MIF4G domain-containing protein n=1 Tax=Rhamnusium bicolor TaxID=1586634 RepID=A0AAV8XDE4_9CUCU|nr:hypothetical protein NQ314_012045 [Rhamnusium bicolor]
MENKPMLWDKNSETFQSLRQPNSIPGTLEIQEANSRQPSVYSQSNIVKNNRESNIKLEASEIRLPTVKTELTVKEEKLKDIIANSTLKADAPEWFPSCVSNNIQSSTSNIQKRLKIHKQPQDTDYLQNSNIAEKYSDNVPDQCYSADEDSPDIIRLKQIINTLTKDPGQFDNLLDLFMETLLPYFEDIIALSIIAQLLVEQAINNSNFRYTGARLCWYVEQNCPEFRAELHLKCKKQLEDNVNKQNVLLFIAELYTQLPHLTVYGALLIDSFKQLLTKGGNDNVKCICQALKLTGHSLEQSNKTDLDEVLSQLKSVKNSVSGSVSTLVNSVINLRSSNWGYSSETSDNMDPVTDGFYYKGLPNTVFYHTDGHMFTSEEKEFLAAHMDSNAEYLSDNSDPDDLCNPNPKWMKKFRQLLKNL